MGNLSLKYLQMHCPILHIKWGMRAGSKHMTHLEPVNLIHYSILTQCKTLYSRCLKSNFEHVAGSPPRKMVWPRENWIQQNTFIQFGTVGFFLPGSNVMSCLFEWPSWLLKSLSKSSQQSGSVSRGLSLEETQQVSGLKLMSSKGQHKFWETDTKEYRRDGGGR